MKAIELTSKTDNEGNLRLDYQLGKKEKDVRVLILIDENHDDFDNDDVWLTNIAQSPSFEFLYDPEEYIYTLDDGEPIDD